MLPSTPTLARAAATLLAAAACSAAPSPAARDSTAVTASTPAAAPAPGPATPGSAPAAAPARPDSSSAAPAPVRSSFTRILSQHTSGFDESAEQVIRDRAALASAWTRLFNGIPGNAPPSVDFARETVILVALGSRSSGGHTVHVDAVAQNAGGTVVKYTATSPGAGCMTTQSLTAPVDVVRTPRIEGTVRFERRDVVQRC